MALWTGLHLVDNPNSDNPLLNGSHINVWTLINEYDGGASSEQIASKFRLPMSDVQAVLSFAHRYLPETDPIDWSHCEAVERVPGRCGGVPLMRGTRMPADGVIQNAGDMSPAEIAENFDLDVDDVRAVIAFVAKLRSLPLAS